MYKDYSNYDIEDFAFDESFQRWVVGGNFDDEIFWKNYLEKHPHQVDKILAARELVKKLTNEEEDNQDSMVDAIWDNVNERISKEPIRLSVNYAKWRIAASILLVLGIGTALWFRLSPANFQTLSSIVSPANDKSIIEKTNNDSKTTRITLADGSTVYLEKGSRLTYPKSFETDKRVVHLHGEAFFEVVKKPKSPFLIYANKTVTKVLGTSFRIIAHDDSPKVVVEVRTGKVSVFETKDFEKSTQESAEKGVLLMPNQQVVFTVAEENFSKQLVENPIILQPVAKGSFNFDQTPLAEVFKTLEEAYGIEIVYDSKLVKNRSLKVSLEDETLYEKLDLICQTMGMSYQLVNTKIIITEK